MVDDLDAGVEREDVGGCAGIVIADIAQFLEAGDAALADLGLQEWIDLVGRVTEHQAAPQGNHVVAFFTHH